jgi:hypothetical protein
MNAPRAGRREADRQLLTIAQKGLALELELETSGSDDDAAARRFLVETGEETAEDKAQD